MPPPKNTRLPYPLIAKYPFPMRDTSHSRKFIPPSGSAPQHNYQIAMSRFAFASRTVYAPVESNEYEHLEEVGMDQDGGHASSPAPLQIRRTIANEESSRSQTGSRASLGDWSDLGESLNVHEGAEHGDSSSRSRAMADTELSHPTPDLQSLQGAYLGSIMRLEDHAERLSLGMDIDMELRKLSEEQRQSESRRGSVAHSGSREQSRRGSIRKLGGDIVDSPPASTGGLDQNEYSALDGSGMNSSSYSHVSGSLMSPTREGQVDTGSPSRYKGRKVSSRKSSRLSFSNTLDLSALPEHQEEHQEEYPVGGEVLEGVIPFPPSHETPYYDEHPRSVIPDHEAPSYDYEPRGIIEGDHAINHNGSYDHSMRPASAGSGDTYQQAAILFRDFDGVHTENHHDPSIRGPSPAPSAIPSILQSGAQPGRRASQNSLADTLALPLAKRESIGPIVSSGSRPKSQMFPPVEPPEGMTFYPAPVPAVIKLPKRLTKGPSAFTVHNHKSAILGAANNRHSRLQPGMFDSAAGLASARDNMNLNPHLRASLFFDGKPALTAGLGLTDGSATKTLDKILDAAATAPLDAFTDHPIVGKLGDEVYGQPEDGRRSRAATDTLANRRSVPNVLQPMQAYKSRAVSALSYPYTVDEVGDRDAEHGVEQTPLSHLDNSEGDDDGYFRRGEDDAERDHDHEYYDEEYGAGGQPEEEQLSWTTPYDAALINGKPTTLLAELQLRKAEQKTRTRTAATAFPNGMHSTLLQLDAVAQHQQRARQLRQVRLAWEDPTGAGDGMGGGRDDDEDEDVPLGMLLPGARRPRGGLQPPVPRGRTPDPRSLIGEEDEEREEGEEEEEEETLGERKERLAREAGMRKRDSMYTLDLPGLEKDVECIENEEEETLRHRQARVKRASGSIDGLGRPESRVLSSEFASETMTQLGTVDKDEEESKRASQNSKEEDARGRGPSRLKGRRRSRGASQDLGRMLGDNRSNSQFEAPEEETLGQRRRRLQMEKAQKEEVEQLHQHIRRTSSSADLLLQPGEEIARGRQPIYNDISQQHMSNGVGFPMMQPVYGLQHNNSMMPKLMMADAMANYTTPTMGMQMGMQQHFNRFAGAPMINPAFNATSSSFANGYGIAMHQQQANQMQNPMRMQQQQQQQQQQYPQQQRIPNPLLMRAGQGTNSTGTVQLRAQQHQQHAQHVQQMVETGITPQRRDMVDRWRSGVN